jgi:predicted transcriptional regulator
MSKTEQLAAVAERLSEEQVDALLSLAHSMVDEPFYDKAPPEALASLERGLEQIARGETVSLDELSKRLEAAAKPSGA